MAASLALKRLVSSTLLSRSVNSLRPAASAASSRLFNTNVARDYDDDDDERGLDVDRRSNRPLYNRRDYSPYFGVFDPFSTRSVSQLLDLVNQFSEPTFASGVRRGWDIKETAEGLNLSLDMPGLGKEDVKVSVEQNTLIIKGEGQKESEDAELGRRFSSRLDLPEKTYKTDGIKAEMKNGVLKVFIPRVKEEERSDVFHVNVQ
ncbi:heat shock 22 kDa protein, mitochondrial [Coffea arabica]|uniref:Heat shock 22 kDa protein, mitochondrial n=1 Tax=Coffea arabica TaxID=13443 RepID=A0A6P6VMM2_COFAR|nr:heat shock 22 kDa protein, mitochondrial-like [Coffea arabica]